MDKKQLFSQLPSVDQILNNDNIITLLEEYPRVIVLESIRESIDVQRKKILSLDDKDIKDFYINEDKMIHEIKDSTKAKYSLSLRKVINGTGVVIHTNLGRSLISDKIKDEVWGIASRYSNLEYDLNLGERGSRYSHLENIIKRITNAEDVLVVNNNAAAVLLVLSTLCKDKEAIVSRGELVEVGGSFRIPSVMEQSGAKLVEVGSTNKTYIKDYEEAINENTSALLKVHTSNYRILGFTHSVEINELSDLGKKYNIPVVEDLGSGLFIDLSKYGFSYEPTVMDSLKGGADIVTFSGDKILGGPQAGIIVGKKEYIQKMKKNQLTRALRVDKFTMAALEATFRMYLDEDMAIKNIPTIKMLTYNIEELESKANALYNCIKSKNLEIDINIEDGYSQVGGGSMPLEKISTKLVSIVPNNISVAAFERKLRLCDNHIIGRVYDNKYILDVRTIFEDEFDIIADTIKGILY
ncbi:L-seryl-tRNA(Sec) selenium transferase [Alkalithermobacter paradoxus]|uniref:L-seryl-tRNA(Sec) selenium transferase n=1 Tax=Alkalithermobacter paradoxus TaxID=29349 RepID=A0A1V4I6I2_9FIRM|nr:L-seryl-tRNA(Sec) selenium transferase [[Clostridium] thermoalcaliphilum]